ncbi:MAG: hypothetical protein LBU79_10265 [Planctomycetota bacterium]|jgi:ATP-dependent DNA helicase RecG|nr:hypothetical protein [Planctomycetota bacterium]
MNGLKQIIFGKAWEYNRILAFFKNHPSDPFYLEGIERRSLRDIIFREVASNMLIHREYASGVSARIIIEYGKVTTFNANHPHGFGLLDPETSVPIQKNMSIFNMYLPNTFCFLCEMLFQYLCLN